MLSPCCPRPVTASPLLASPRLIPNSNRLTRLGPSSCIVELRAPLVAESEASIAYTSIVHTATSATFHTHTATLRGVPSRQVQVLLLLSGLAAAASRSSFNKGPFQPRGAAVPNARLISTPIRVRACASVCAVRVRARSRDDNSPALLSSWLPLHCFNSTQAATTRQIPTCPPHPATRGVGRYEVR